MIINTATKEYPLSVHDLSLLFQDKSFPVASRIQQQHLPVGFALVSPVDRPAVDHTENVVEGAPELIDGVWTQRWVIEPASAEEVMARTEDKAAEVRAKRNQLLLDSDWTQGADAASRCDQAAWAIYRSKLADITLQAGFPWNVQWPEV